MSLRKVTFSLFLLLVVSGGCAQLPKERIISFVQENDLMTLCKKNNISWHWDSLSQVVTLKENGKRIKILVGSDTVFLGEQVILLSAPVVMANSTVIVPPDFKKRVISVFKKKEAIREVVRMPSQIKTIVLDAGHGGKDPGAIGRSGLQEKEVNLDIVLRLYRILKNQGYEVVVTRRDDTFISLQERTEIASAKGADLFVSIHANSNPKRSVHGLEVYKLRNLDFYEQKEEQRLNNHHIMFKNLSMKQDDKHLKGILADMLYIHKQTETNSLASYLAKKTSSYARAKNRGVKNARFYVLRNTLIPAVLIEAGYLTNPKEERMLSVGSYRHKIAMGIAQSINGYMNGRK